jgi:hypothetical protein
VTGCCDRGNKDSDAIKCWELSGLGNVSSKNRLYSMELVR